MSGIATAAAGETPGTAAAKGEAMVSLLVFADDWGRHPSSCQHLIRELLPRYRVGWVNTIGMRPPSLNWATLRRGLEKLTQWTGTTASNDELAPNLSVLAPLMWPSFRRKWNRALNQWLLERSLRSWLNAAQGPVVAITTLPIVADLMQSLPVAKWVYYCVDDFGTWPGLDQPTMAAMERELIQQADQLIAVSRTLRDRIADQRRDTEIALLTHGVHVDHWRPDSQGGFNDNVSVDEELPSPLVTFWGLVDQRLDANVVRAVAESLPQGTVALVGPSDHPDAALDQIPRVQRIPPVSYSRLPALAHRSSVLLMPYRDMPVTRAMQPLKLLEYLATERPVVARRLPSTNPWSDCLDLAESPQEFAEAVRRRIRSGLPPAQQQARQRIQQESWAEKAKAFERLIVHGLPSHTA